MTRKYYLAGAVLIAAALVATLIAYPRLPESVPTHWDLQGHVDGYSPRWALLLIGPGLMAGIMILFRLLPWLSPKQWEMDSFRATYLYVMVVLVCLLGYLHVLTLWAGIGRRIDVGRAATGGLCLLFVLLGNVLGKVRRNFYIGVRTPWALANDHVWNATHRMAAKSFVVTGLVGLALTAVGFSFWPAMAALMIGAVVPAVYSLVFYKQMERAGEL